MATLKQIQEKVNQAQEVIRNRNFDHVRTVIWPSIKTDLGQCVDLDWKYRGDMGRLIYKNLNEQNLQGGISMPINLEQQKAALQAGNVTVPEPTQVYRWLPY
jgi:hypothetical protein